MKALITGGSGYFGSLLVKRLLNQDWECKVFDINEFNGIEEIEFIKGGPKLPETTLISTLKSWTVLNQDAENFSGTAKYETTFNKPKLDADNWQLNLGDLYSKS